jgi:protocatechuate 3,4-dioxygenase beta subunit
MISRLTFVLLLCLASPVSAAITGLVYSSNGDPISGALIEARPVERYEDAVGRLVSDAPELTPLASATTDATGTFTLDPKTSGIVSLRASAKGHAPIRTLASSTDNEVVLVLRGATMRTGRVRTSKGPVADATVALLDTDGQPLAILKTDEQGIYRIPDPSSFDSATVCVRHKDFAPVCNTGYSNDGLQLNVTMTPSRRVGGRVVDGEGKGVAGARVFAAGWPLATSQKDGAFVIGHLPDNVREIRASSGAHYASASVAAENVTVTLSPASSINGSVLDEKSRPIAGVLVTALAEERSEQSSTHPDWFTAVTDAKGTYRIEGLPAGKYSVYPSVTDDWDVDSQETDLRRQRSAKLDFSLKAAEVIRGTVRDEKNRPVSGAVLIASNPEMPLIYGTGPFGYVFGATGPAGQFTIPSPSKTKATFVIMKSGFAAAKHEVTANSKSPISITLPRGIAVSGIVVDVDGNPQSDAHVMAAEAKSIGSFPLGATLASGHMQPWVKTTPDGRFTIHLNRGTHDLGVWKSPFAAEDVIGVDVSERVTELKVVLERGVDIRGRITRAKGALPDGGQIVAMSPEMQTGAQGEIQPDGSFLIPSLPAGKYMILYQAGSTTAQKMVDAPATDVVIELPELNEISGRVVDKGTALPLETFTVATSNSDSRFHDSSEVNNPLGVFTQSAPAGPVEITVQAPGYVAEKRVVDASAPAKDLVFALSRGRKIAGRITSSNGPVPSADISIEAESGPGNSATTDDMGEYEITGVSLDETSISFSSRGFVSQTQALPAGTADQRMDIKLVTGLKVTGRVIDSTGSPVEEAMVFAYSAAHAADSQHARTGKDGTFTMEGLAPAHYDFSARKPMGGGEAELDDVDVKNTPSIVLSIESAGKATIRGTVTGVSGAGWLMAMVYASNGDASASAQIGRDGTFVIEDAPAGEITVRGMMMAMDREGSTSPATLNVAEGQTAEVQLTVATDPVIRGSVSADGKPLVGAHVTFDASGGGMMSGRWRATTDSAGVYEIKGISRGEYGVQVTQLSDERFKSPYKVTGSATFNITIEETQIAGRVIDEAGNPIGEARIKATTEGGEHDDDAQAVSDESGHFRVKVQAGAQYRVTANRKGFAATSSSVNASSGNLVVLKMARAEGTAVRIVDARNGATLSGYVVVTDESGATQIDVTHERQSDGSLHLPLPAGRYRLSASASDYSSATVRLTVPSAVESRLALTPGGTLLINSKSGGRHLIKLVLPSGEEYIRCHCNGIAEIRIEGSTTTVDHVAAGSYRMSVIENGTVKTTYPVTIIEGQTSVVEIAE